MVEHYGIMEDVPVLVFAWYLLLCEVGTGHLDESVPGVFDDTVGDLSFGVGCDDLGSVVVDTLESLALHDFLFEVGMEAAG